MKAPHHAIVLPAVLGALATLGALAACTEPQTPSAGGPGATATATATAVPTLTAIPTGASGVTATAPGTAAPTATGAATAAPAEKLTQPFVLTYRQTGGIAGMRMETIVDSAAKKITYGGLRNQKPETRELTAEELAAITRVLEEARFTSFPGAIKSRGIVADGFEYSLVLKTGGKEYAMSWWDGATVSDAYSSVRTTVNAIRAGKFDGKSPAGAPTM